MADEFDPNAFLQKHEAPTASGGFDPNAFLQKHDPTWGETAIDVAKQVPAGLIKGVETMATGPAQLVKAAEDAGLGELSHGNEDPFGIWAKAKPYLPEYFTKPVAEVPTGKKGIEQYLPEPATTAGKYARTASEFVPGAAAMPGKLAVGIPAAVAGGLASEAGGQALEPAGPGYEAAGRIGGALAGATAGGIGFSAGAKILGRLTGIGEDTAAAARMAKALKADNDTPEALIQRLQEVRQVKPEATIADVAKQGVRDLLENVAQEPGAGRNLVVPFLEQRQKAQMGRLANDLTAATGTRQTAYKAIEETMAERKANAAPLYEQTYADGDRAVWNPKLEQLTAAPFVQAAMRKAVSVWRNNAVADGYGAMNPGAVVDRGGMLTFTGGQIPAFPNVQFWDYTKRQLDDMTSAAIRAGQSQKARTLTKLTQDLRANLDAEVPSYRAAREAWAGPSAYLEAIGEGKSIISRNMTAEELTARLAEMSSSEREGYRIGAVSAIRNAMGSNPAKMPDWTRVMRSAEMRAKIGAMMPNPGANQNFQQALDHEIATAEVTAQSLGNSATFRRQAQAQEADSIFGQLARDAFAHKLGLGFFKSIYQNTLGKPTQAWLHAKSNESLAKMLTDITPAAPLRLTVRPSSRRGAALPTAGGVGVGLGATLPNVEEPQPESRQAGGGVPAIGGTGGRSQGAGAAAGARGPRPWPSQALQDGGEAREQSAAPVGLREKHEALLGSSPGSGGFSAQLAAQKRPLKVAKGPPATSREDIYNQLRGRGIPAEGWGAFEADTTPEGYLPRVDSRARGGSLDYPTGEREITGRAKRVDPTDNSQWENEDDENYTDPTSRVMTPGESFIDYSQSQGWRDPGTGIYQTLGMADGGLAEQVGVNDVGRNRYVPPPRADWNAPLDPQVLHHYLAAVGNPSYPTFPPFGGIPMNQEALASFPESLNIEDRRGGGSRDPTRRRAEGGDVPEMPEALERDAFERTAAAHPALTRAAGAAAANREAKEAGAPPSAAARALDYAGRQGGNAFFRPEEFDPAPSAETAMAVVGSPFSAVRGAGTVLGAGAVRRTPQLAARASPEEIARAAEASGEMTQPQLRQLYHDLGLIGQPPSSLVKPSLQTQTPAAIEAATRLKMADRAALETLTSEERKAFQQGRLKKPGFQLPSQEAAEPGKQAFAPVKKEITRAEKEFDVLREQGTAPSIFDLSPETLRRMPDVEQFPLPRVAPKMTERLAPAAQGGLRRIESAAGKAGPGDWGWYNIQEPLATFPQILGPERGPQAQRAWIDALAGTSMVNPISSNVRGSSYYLGNVMRGEPLPQVISMTDPVSGKTVQALAGPPPAGYGAKSQVQHAARVREYLQNMGDPVSNPKPFSYRQNLSGNYGPRTVDTHDIRNMVGMPYGAEAFGEGATAGGLLPGEYAALERLGGRAAQRAGVPQAQQQAATWIGGGEYTGLKSIPVPLAVELNRRAWVTAKVRGITPEQAWAEHVTGRRPLLGLGGAAVVGAGALRPGGEEQQ